MASSPLPRAVRGLSRHPFPLLVAGLVLLTGCGAPPPSTPEAEASTVSQEAALAGAVELDLVTGRIYSELYAGTTVQDDLYNMGIRWVRIEFEEHGNPITPDWKYDKILADLKNRGIGVLGVLTANSCIDKTNPPGSEAYIANFYAAVKWHVKRYPSVTHWEVWNEPENYGFQNNGAGYALLLKRVFEWGRTDRQNGTLPAATRFLCAGSVNMDLPHLRSIYDARPINDFRAVNGGDIPCDIFAMHPYGRVGAADNDPWSTRFLPEGRSFEQGWQAFENYTTANGQWTLVPRSKPVWFTEWGFDSRTVGTENQRIFTERMIYSMVKYPRIQKAFLYRYNDANDGWGVRSAVTGGQRKRVYYPYVSHATLTGLYTPDGSAEWTLDQFIDAHQRNGGRAKVGLPYRDPAAPWYGDKVHNWSDGKVQNFNGGSYGDNALLESPRRAGFAYNVRGAFWQRYKAIGGPYSSLKFPTTDEYAVSGGVRQDFEGGYLLWDSVNGVRQFSW
jgi:hypothetical protein